MIRLSGPDAISICQKIISRDLLTAESNKALFCRVMDGDIIVDEVVVVIYRNPHSFTGEDSVEIELKVAQLDQARTVA